MTFYAIRRTDGGVSIMQTIGDAKAGDEINKWPQNVRFEHDVSYIREIDYGGLPKDRTFRNAWRHDLSIDIEKARDIHRDKMRAARAPLLAALDIEYQRADESGDAVAKEEIIRKKRLLRDVTSLSELVKAKTVEQIKSVWPTILG